MHSSGVREDFYVQSGLRDLPERAIVELAYLVTMREVAHPELRAFFKKTIEIYSRRKLEEGGIDHSADLPEMEDIGGEYMFKSTEEDEPAAAPCPPVYSSPYSRPDYPSDIITIDDDNEEELHQSSMTSSQFITLGDSPERISPERKANDSPNTIQATDAQTCNLTPPDSTYKTESPQYDSETSNYPSPKHAPYSPGDVSLSPINEKQGGVEKSPEYEEPYDPASPGDFSLSPQNEKLEGGGETPEYEPLSPQYEEVEEMLNQSQRTSRAAAAADLSGLQQSQQSRPNSRAGGLQTLQQPQQRSRPSSRTAESDGAQQAQQSLPPDLQLQQAQQISRPVTPSEHVMQQSRLNTRDATARPQLRKRPRSQDVTQQPPDNPTVQQSLPQQLLTPQLSCMLSKLQLLQQSSPIMPAFPPAIQPQQLLHRPNGISLPNFSVPPPPLPPLHKNPLMFPPQGWPPFIPPPPIVQPHEIPLPPQYQSEWSQCPFCWSPHSPENCDEYPRAAQREKRQRELILCVHCLGKHPKRVCHVQEHMRRCTVKNCGKHSTHVALCRVKYPEL